MLVKNRAFGGGGGVGVRDIQWLKKMSQCLHDLERSDWCNPADMIQHPEILSERSIISWLSNKP
jgi:hypothetical protein